MRNKKGVAHTTTFERERESLYQLKRQCGIKEELCIKHFSKEKVLVSGIKAMRIKRGIVHATSLERKSAESKLKFD